MWTPDNGGHSFKERNGRFEIFNAVHSDTIDEKLLEVDTKVSQVDVVNVESIKTLIDDHKNLHVGVRDLEDRSRRNNLCFDGLSQAQGEDWHGSEAKIKKLIKEKLGIEDV